MSSRTMRGPPGVGIVDPRLEAFPLRAMIWPYFRGLGLTPAPRAFGLVRSPEDRRLAIRPCRRMGSRARGFRFRRCADARSRRATWSSRPRAPVSPPSFHALGITTRAVFGFLADSVLLSNAVVVDQRDRLKTISGRE